MSRFYLLDENKNAVPCDLYKWGKRLEEMSKEENKHVAHEIIDGKKISTVWLGMDHQWGDIFETMVFPKGSYQEIYLDRYSTWKEAEEGHKKAVKWVKNGCKEEESVSHCQPIIEPHSPEE